MQTNYMSRVARKRFFGVHAADSPAFDHVHDVDTEKNTGLLQFYTDSFKTSLVFWSWSEDMHVIKI